jgi:hypothetical protein
MISLVSNILSAAASAILCELLPGFPQYCVMHRFTSWITHLGFGKDVAALSK